MECNAVGLEDNKVVAVDGLFVLQIADGFLDIYCLTPFHLIQEGG